MSRLAALLAAALYSVAFAVPAAHAQDRPEVDAAAPAYRVGQYWSYDARPQDKDSRIFIMKIDGLSDGTRIYHLLIENVLLTPNGGTPVTTAIGHVPVTRETMDISARERLTKLPAPQIAWGGYDMWRDAFSRGKAAWFKIPIKEIVDGIDSGL